MKKLFIVVLTLLATFLLSGCGNKKYPVVLIDESKFADYMQISIGQPYKYDGFDISNTDGGKDVILHFIKGAEE